MRVCVCVRVGEKRAKENQTYFLKFLNIVSEIFPFAPPFVHIPWDSVGLCGRQNVSRNFNFHLKIC